MKKLALFLIFLFTFPQAWGQVNLVKNPSFESYNQCPTGFDQIRFANNWNDIDTTAIYPYGPACSPDYCNTCANPNGLIGIPFAQFYNHYPRTGNGMMEMQVYFDNSFSLVYKRDYIQGKFITNLTYGASYCITFYVVLDQSSQYAINHLGAYIDDGAIDAGQDSVGCARPQTAFHPQIVEDSILSDTLNWVKVQGSYTANGTEKFITIGNFFDIHHTDTIKRNLWYFPWNTANPASWYSLDDVSVMPSSTIADAGPYQWVSPGSDSVFICIPDEGLPTKWYIAGNPAPLCYGWGGFKVHPDTTTKYVVVLDLCGNVTSDTVTVHVASVGIKDVQGGVNGFNQSYKLLPNPNNGSFSLQQNVRADGQVDFEILNTTGQSIHKGVLGFVNGTAQVYFKEHKPGLYLLKLIDNKGNLCILKFTIE